MKLGLIVGIVAGVIIGAATMFLVGRHSAVDRGSADIVPLAPPLQGPMAGSPLVGMWRLDILPMTVTYDFKDDGTFTQRFKGVPVAPLGQSTSHDAGGTWKVDGSTLVMRNTRSNTPFTVVGEVESATIISTAPNRLALANVNRKGKAENLALDRIQPFIPGKCDKPTIIGNWQSPQWGQMELRQGGDLVRSMRNGETREGRWSQQAGLLRMQINPPNSSAGRQQRWNPTLYDMQENAYEILDLSSDGQTFEIKSVRVPGLPEAAPITLRRSTIPIQSQVPSPQPGRRRPSGMK